MKLVLDLCSSITSSRIALKTVCSGCRFITLVSLSANYFLGPAQADHFHFYLGAGSLQSDRVQIVEKSPEREREKTQLPSQVHDCYSFAVLFDS